MILSSGELYNFNVDNVNKDNFIVMQDILCFSDELKHAHEEWEKVDADWKMSLKDGSDSFHVMNLASKVRLARSRKDIVFDKAADLALEIAEKVNIIEEWNR